MIFYFLVAASIVGKVQLQQITANISNEGSSPYQCYSEFVLKCEVSGTTCCSDTKRWEKDGIAIDTVSDPKYKEELFTSEGYFTLTIKDVVKSDLGVPYSCEYSISLQSIIDVDGIVHCGKCGGFCFLWTLIGVVVAFIVCFLIHFKVKQPKWNKKKIIVTSLVSVFISLVLSGAIAVPVCIVKSLCLDSPRLDPLFILLGLVLEVFLFFILGKCIGKPPKGSGGADSSGSRFTCCRGNTVCAGPNPGEPSDRRPPQGVRRPEIRESAQAGAHKRTENSSPKKNEYASKLDSVPKDRPLPQIGDDSPRPLPQLDQGKSNVPRLDPLGVTEDSGEKKKKKKKRKKQQENDEVET